jgi:hypothetical protein
MLMTATRRLLVVTTMLATVTGSPLLAAQSKCLVGRTKCVAKLALALLKCHQAAEAPGKLADPNAKGCIDKAHAQFNGGVQPDKGCLAKLESKRNNDCGTTADSRALEAGVENCVDTLVLAIDPDAIDQTKCGVAKKKCAATELGALLNCQQKAQTPGKPVDPNAKACVDKAAAKFDGGPQPAKGCFAKQESKAKNDCVPPLGNAAAVGALVDACVDHLVGLLQGGATPEPPL